MQCYSIYYIQYLVIISRYDNCLQNFVFVSLKLNYINIIIYSLTQSEKSSWKFTSPNKNSLWSSKICLVPYGVKLRTIRTA